MNHGRMEHFLVYAVCVKCLQRIYVLSFNLELYTEMQNILKDRGKTILLICLSSMGHNMCMSSACHQLEMSIK